MTEASQPAGHGLHASGPGGVYALPFAHPVASGITGAVTIAFSSIFVRLSGASPETAAVFRCLYASVPLGILAWEEDRRLGPRKRWQRGPALLAGILFAFDLILWHHSIAAVGAGLATALANLQVVVVGLAAWLGLGERPQPRLLGAIPLALLGVGLISGVLEEGAYGSDPVGGSLLGLGSAVAYSGFLLLLRRGGGDLRRPAGPLFDGTLVGALVALTGGLLTGSVDLVPEWPGHGWLLLLALSSQVLGWLLITISLPRLPALQTSALLLIQPVGSVLLAMLILGERPSGLQLGGVLLVLAGVLLAAGRAPNPEPAA